MSWADAAQLPLALLTPDMRIRQVIDNAFAESGVAVTPQVETDSVASLYAQVGVGAWASIVPHTWLRAMPVVGRTRAVRLVEPDTRAQVSVATHAATPGSVVARAFVTAAQGLRLDEFFDRPCRPSASSADCAQRAYWSSTARRSSAPLAVWGKAATTSSRSGISKGDSLLRQSCRICLGSDALVLGHHHGRADTFPVRRVGDREHGRLGDAATFGEDGLDVLGRDLFAAAVDDVLDAPGEEQVSVLVH